MNDLQPNFGYGQQTNGVNAMQVPGIAGGSAQFASSPNYTTQSAYSSNPASPFSYNAYNPKAPQVLGGSTQITPPPKAAPPSGGSGGGGGSSPSELQQLQAVGGQRNPVQETRYQQLLQAQQQQPGQTGIDFDALIKPAIDALQAAIPGLQQTFADQQTGIQNWQQNQTDTTNQSIGAQTQQLNATGQSQDTGAKNAMDEARRMQSEIQQGLQARYGGTTGTGAFAGELSGRQASGDINKLQQGLQQAHLEIGNRLQQVQETGRIALSNIQNQAQDQINTARDQLQKNLDDIRREQGNLQMNKSQMAANAMQHYQDTVNQVNAQNAQFKQQLVLQQQQAENQLNLAKQYIGQYGGYAGNTYNATNFSTPVGGTGQSSETGPVQGGQQIDPRLLQQQGGQQTIDPTTGRPYGM